MNITIDTLRPEHAQRFADLNRAWLDEYHLMEPADEVELADPRAPLCRWRRPDLRCAPRDAVVGTCAVRPTGGDEFELAKLTVSPELRGQGIARRLVERCSC